ncbi:hypothetical protein MPSEU_000677200 [Mayamaea pseudoterrestris]|nr:hypothetical protein MPSEU_000677200 [Mayamaea pseudoterrestris]
MSYRVSVDRDTTCFFSDDEERQSIRFKATCIYKNDLQSYQKDFFTFTVDSDRDIASTVGSDERDRTTCRSNLPQLPSNRLIIATCFAILLGFILIVSKYNSFELQEASLHPLLDRASRIDKHLHHHSHQWKVIHDTLKSLDKEITGNVFFHNDEKLDKTVFDHASQVWVASVAPPYAVIEVASERDVQIALHRAITPMMQRYSDLEFRVRSGGHNKAGYSTVASGIVLSLARLNRITNMDLDGDTVTMQPAVLVEQFMQQVTLPYNYSGVVGFCKQVAESGFVLGGGFGLTSRLYGMGMDNVLSMRIVLVVEALEW